MQTLTAPIHRTIGRARHIADQTPATRNRYVDFLRALSIIAVVVGHWLIAAPFAAGGELRGVNMLAHTPSTQWLTWVFQVMPVFFAVGGYSNTASWTAAKRGGQSYANWLTARLRRLTVPLIPLLTFWAVLGAVTVALGVDHDLIRLGSQSALVPVWFLSVYVVITAVSPALVELWNRHGWRSYVALVGAALLVDLAVASGTGVIGWVNYLFVWSAMHQLGVAWRSGALSSWRAGTMSVFAAAAVIALVTVGPYPIAMVGVPGAAASNNSPPTFAMVAFGTMQITALLAVEARARRVLERRSAWTATVLVNGSIMTLYLWHMTAMILAVGAMLMAGGVGLGIEPSTAGWWLSRPLWILGLLAVTVPFLVVFGRREQVRPMSEDARPNAVAAWVAVVATCTGLGLLAGHGVLGGFLGIRIEALALPVAAALTALWMGRAVPERLRH